MEGGGFPNRAHNEMTTAGFSALMVQQYHQSRTHLSLGKDGPEPRSVQPPSAGNVIAFPQVGGLHHRYGRRAA